MKNLLASLVLATQILVPQPISSETIFRYNNYEKKEVLEYVIKNSTIKKSPTGSIPVNFSVFQKIGFDYKLLGNLSHDLGMSEFIVKEPKTKSYIIKYPKGTTLMDAIEEHIEADRANLSYLIRMKPEDISIAVNFEAVPHGSNTDYKADVYVRPDNWGKRTIFTILSLIPSFDKMMGIKIDNLNKTSENLFQKLRENPNEIYKTSISDEEKRRIRSLFE